MPNINEVIVFLWGEYHNADSDGDASGPECVQWTNFWCRSRVDQGAEFEIELNEGIWKVTASSEALKSRIALLFATQFEARIFADKELIRECEVNQLLLQSGDFSLVQAKDRLRKFRGYPK